MKRYRVKTTCWGFKGRMWDEGTIVDLEDDCEPPKHFELINPGEESNTANAGQGSEGVDTQKPLPYEIGRPLKPKGGFAKDLNPKGAKLPITSGDVLKDNKK